MDFWPEDDSRALSLVHNVLGLPNANLTNPECRVYWLPRLMQAYTGQTSIFSESDAYLTFLMANLAGSTIMTAHVEFLDGHAKQGFESSLNAIWPSELPFSIKDFSLSFTN